jgi:hypothetical protein
MYFRTRLYLTAWDPVALAISIERYAHSLGAFIEYLGVIAEHAHDSTPSGAA